MDLFLSAFKEAAAFKSKYGGAKGLLLSVNNIFLYLQRTTGRQHKAAVP